MGRRQTGVCDQERRQALTAEVGGVVVGQHGAGAVVLVCCSIRSGWHHAISDAAETKRRVASVCVCVCVCACVCVCVRACGRACVQDDEAWMHVVALACFVKMMFMLYTVAQLKLRAVAFLVEAG